MLQILMGTINVFHLPPCKPSFDPEPISSVQTLRPNVLPSFNAQNNTSSSIAHSVGISVPSVSRVSGSGLFPLSLSFPKGLKIFPRSGSVTPLSPSSAVRSLPADQKCGRCYLRIPRRRCSFRRVQRPAAAAPPPQTSFARRRIHTLPVTDLI